MKMYSGKLLYIYFFMQDQCGKVIIIFMQPGILAVFLLVLDVVLLEVLEEVVCLWKRLEHTLTPFFHVYWYISCVIIDSGCGAVGSIGRGCVSVYENVCNTLWLLFFSCKLLYFFVCFLCFETWYRWKRCDTGGKILEEF